jgi:hypothetical protein
MIPAWGKPEQRAKALAIVDSAYGAALAKVPDGLPKNQGIALGQAAAAAMLAARKVDGSSGPRSTRPGARPDSGGLTPTPCPRTRRSPTRLSLRAIGPRCFRSGARSCPS